MYTNEYGDIIGNGEDVVYDILQESFCLEPRTTKEFNKDGIYKTFPVTKLYNSDILQDLSKEHMKGSIDVLVVLNSKVYAIRVQNGGTSKQGKGGHYGDHKAKHDSVQKRLLIGSGVEVVDVWQHECPNIFKNKYTEKSVKELTDSMYDCKLLQFTDKLTLKNQ